jgi:hypothetical protein
VGGKRNPLLTNQMMRRQPAWIQRIPQIRSDLITLNLRLFGTKDIAKLFEVSPGHARRLLGRMGPMLHGNALVVDADDVLKLLSDAERELQVPGESGPKRQHG